MFKNINDSIQNYTCFELATCLGIIKEAGRACIFKDMPENLYQKITGRQRQLEKLELEL